MNLDLKKLPSLIQPILAKINRYKVFGFVIVLLVSYGFLVYRINSLVSSEPTDDQISEKLETVQRPKIDQATLDKIQQLQDQNVDVQTLFTQARENPFTE